MRDRGPPQEPGLEVPGPRRRGSHHALVGPDGASLPREVDPGESGGGQEVRRQDVPADVCLHIRLDRGTRRPRDSRPFGTSGMHCQNFVFGKLRSWRGNCCQKFVFLFVDLKVVFVF